MSLALLFIHLREAWERSKINMRRHSYSSPLPSLFPKIFGMRDMLENLTGLCMRHVYTHFEARLENVSGSLSSSYLPKPFLFGSWSNRGIHQHIKIFSFLGSWWMGVLVSVVPFLFCLIP